jgi:hypothetical protein
MPKLGDFIGALLADVAQARVRADLETVRIAQAYSADGMLKHLPVPRFRLPDLTIDVPVLVSSVAADDDPSGRLFVEPSASEVNAIVLEGLRVADIHLEPGGAQKLGAVGSARMKALFAGDPATLRSASTISSDVTANVVDALRKGAAEDSIHDQIPLAESTIRSRLEKVLVTKLVKSPTLQVAVTASEIKAHNDNESVVRLRLTISEDAYEVVSTGDGEGLTLTPE